MRYDLFRGQANRFERSSKATTYIPTFPDLAAKPRVLNTATEIMYILFGLQTLIHIKDKTQRSY